MKTNKKLTCIGFFFVFFTLFSFVFYEFILWEIITHLSNCAWILHTADDDDEPSWIATIDFAEKEYYI